MHPKGRFSSFIKMISALFIFQGCTIGDSSEELSGNYFYRDEGANLKEIICHLPDSKNIYSKVISYSFDKDFILVAQEPNFEEYKNSVAFELRNDFKNILQIPRKI